MDLPPRRPDDSECCGSGCARCVFDVYEEELKIWKKGLETVSDSEKLALHPKSYSKLKIVDIQEESHNTFIYVLTSADSDEVLVSLSVGQHVILKRNLDKQTISRQYTPINIGRNLKELKILIKIYDDGKMSSIIKHWKVGDSVQCRGPLGQELSYYPNKWETVVLLAAGTGITPMTQIIQTILKNEDEETSIILLYACQTYEEILLKDIIDSWSEHWNFSVFYYLSRDTIDRVKGQKKYNDVISCHKICESSVKQSLPKFLDVVKSYAFICGTHSFNEAVKVIMMHCGFPIERMHIF